MRRIVRKSWRILWRKQCLSVKDMASSEVPVAGAARRLRRLIIEESDDGR